MLFLGCVIPLLDALVSVVNFQIFVFILVNQNDFIKRRDNNSVAYPKQQSFSDPNYINKMTKLPRFLISFGASQVGFSGTANSIIIKFG